MLGAVVADVVATCLGLGKSQYIISVCQECVLDGFFSVPTGLYVGLSRWVRLRCFTGENKEMIESREPNVLL